LFFAGLRALGAAVLAATFFALAAFARAIEEQQIELALASRILFAREHLSRPSPG